MFYSTFIPQFIFHHHSAHSMYTTVHISSSAHSVNLSITSTPNAIENTSIESNTRYKTIHTKLKFSTQTRTKFNALEQLLFGYSSSRIASHRRSVRSEHVWFGMLSSHSHPHAHMHAHTTLIIVWLPASSYIVLCIFRQGYSNTDGTGTNESPNVPN